MHLAILLSLNSIGLVSVSVPAAAERLRIYSNRSTLVTRDGKKDVRVRVFGSRRMEMRRF